MSDNHARSSAIATFKSILDAVSALDTPEKYDEASEEIQNMPLSVSIRSGWYAPGSADNAPEEFEILLSTGGPACRIHGTLDDHAEPISAELQHQDWGTPWTFCYPNGDEVADDIDVEETLLTFARQFYYGG